MFFPNGIAHKLKLIALFTLLCSPVFVGAGSFNGSTKKSKQECKNETFIYETGNGSGGALLRQAFDALGLGTLAADGTFAELAVTPILTTMNGAYEFWTFAGVAITLADRNKNSWTSIGTLTVAKNSKGANETVASRNFLNCTWLAEVCACLGGDVADEQTELHTPIVEGLDLGMDQILAVQVLLMNEESSSLAILGGDLMGFDYLL